MKNALPYIYVVMGFLAGFMVGAAPQHANGFPLERLAYYLASVVVILLYMWFERTSHNRHVSKWPSHRRRSRLHFVLSHYILARAIPILLILTVLINSRLHPTMESVYVLIFTGVIALFAFTFLGYQEWSACEADYSVQSLRETAQRVKETRAGVAGGGA